MTLLLATAPPVEIVPVLAAVAGLLVTTGASITVRSWYVARHSRHEWECLADRDREEEEDEFEDAGTARTTRDGFRK